MREEIKLQKVCQDVLDKDGSILSIILIGSRARGDFKEDSDYDLMFVTKRIRKKEREIESGYNESISKKTKMDDCLISVHVWSIGSFREKYNEGHSFIYCALRDGKILAIKKNSKNILNLKLPDCKKAGKERIEWAKRNIDSIKFSLNFWRKRNPNKKFSGLELEELGYCAMHLVWGVCMLNGFCPLSKYTVLKESRKYFSKKESEAIKKVYKFYSHPNLERRINQKMFAEIYQSLNKLAEKILEKEYEK